MVSHTTPHVKIVPTTIPPIFEIDILEIATIPQAAINPAATTNLATNPTAAINPAAPTNLATNHLAAIKPAANTNLATNNTAAINPAATTNLANNHLAAINPAATSTYIATTHKAAINTAAPTNLATNPKAAINPAAHTNLANNSTAAINPAAHTTLATNHKAAIHPVAPYTLANNNTAVFLPGAPRQPAINHMAAISHTATLHPANPTKDTILTPSAVLPKTNTDLQMSLPLTIPLTVLRLPRIIFLHIHAVSHNFPRKRTVPSTGNDTVPHLLLPELLRRRPIILSNPGRPLLSRLGSPSLTLSPTNGPNPPLRTPDIDLRPNPLLRSHRQAGSSIQSHPLQYLILSNLSSLTFRMLK
jgi:hypothetical protein